MPWKECHVMDERLRSVARLLEGEKMAPLELVQGQKIRARQTQQWTRRIEIATPRTAELAHRRIIGITRRIFAVVGPNCTRVVLRKTFVERFLALCSVMSHGWIEGRKGT